MLSIRYARVSIVDISGFFITNISFTVKMSCTFTISDRDLIRSTIILKEVAEYVLGLVKLTL